MNSKSQNDSCCPDWNKAQEPCTDNEGYSKLIHNYGGAWLMGTDLNPIQFCPWCGDPKTASSFTIKCPHGGSYSTRNRRRARAFVEGFNQALDCFGIYRDGVQHIGALGKPIKGYQEEMLNQIERQEKGDGLPGGQPCP